MQRNISDPTIVTKLIKNESGISDVHLEDLHHYYNAFCESVGDDHPRVMVIRLERALQVQFSEYSKFRIHVPDRKKEVKREDLEKFIRNLVWIDPTSKYRNFLGLFVDDIKGNRCIIILICIVVIICSLFIGIGNNFSSLFSITSQVVSVFAAVFVVFTTTSRQDQSQIDLVSFKNGNMLYYYCIDDYICRISILCIFSSLLGVLLTGSPPRTVPLIVGEWNFSFDPVVCASVGLVLLILILLYILFMSLPEYYLMGRRRYRLGEMGGAVLDEDYSAYH